MTVAYGAVLSRLVLGDPFDARISNTLMKLVKKGELPFHAVTLDNLEPAGPDAREPSRAGKFASPDALLTPSFIARAAENPNIAIEPAWKASLVYGMPCVIYHILPSAYYLAARFTDDFESAVLNAINGGGQNQARAILVRCLFRAPSQDLAAYSGSSLMVWNREKRSFPCPRNWRSRRRGTDLQVSEKSL